MSIKKKGSFYGKSKEPQELSENRAIYNVIGSMISDKVFLLWCFKHGVDENLFPTETSKIIFEAVKYVHKANCPVNIFTVNEHLFKDKTISGLSFLVVSSTDSVNVSQAYAYVKSKIGYKEHESIISDHLENPINNNTEYAKRYTDFLQCQECKQALKRLTDPSTNSYDRQFFAGFIRAIEVLNSYMKEKEEPVEVLPLRPLSEKFPLSSSSFDDDVTF